VLGRWKKTKRRKGGNKKVETEGSRERRKEAEEGRGGLEVFSKI
jgi:hypothetical protein